MELNDFIAMVRRAENKFAQYKPIGTPPSGIEYSNGTSDELKTFLLSLSDEKAMAKAVNEVLASV